MQQTQSTAGDALFLHAYLDDLGTSQCLQASVDLSKGVPLLSYSISCPVEVPAATAGRAQRHFENLNLNEYYSQLANRDAMRVARQVAKQVAANVPLGTIRASIREEASNSEPEYGPNSWRVVMLRALAAHTLFCSGACTNIIP